jgi:hypothetical protein
VTVPAGQARLTLVDDLAVLGGPLLGEGHRLAGMSTGVPRRSEGGVMLPAAVAPTLANLATR